MEEADRDLLVGCGPDSENEEDVGLLGSVPCGHQGQGFPGEANLQKPMMRHLGGNAVERPTWFRLRL